MTRWEYRIIQRELTEVELNRLGEEGWELVAKERFVQRKIHHKWYFKRPKEEEATSEKEVAGNA